MVSSTAVTITLASLSFGKEAVNGTSAAKIQHRVDHEADDRNRAVLQSLNAMQYKIRPPCLDTGNSGMCLRN